MRDIRNRLLSAATVLATYSISVEAQLSETRTPLLISDSARAGSLAFWASAGAGVTAASTLRQGWVNGHFDLWTATRRLAAGVKLTRIEDWSYESSREKSLLVGLIQPIGDSDLLVAIGPASLSCGGCSTPQTDTIATNHLLVRTFYTYGRSARGVAWHVEFLVVPAWAAGIGLSVSGATSAAMSYLAPTVTIRFGRTPHPRGRL